MANHAPQYKKIANALQIHNTEDLKQIFSDKALRGLSPQFPHSCVCERFIYCNPRIGPHIFLQQNRQIEGLSQTHECRNWDFSFSGNNCFEFSVLCLCCVRKLERLILFHISLLMTTRTDSYCTLSQGKANQLSHQLDDWEIEKYQRIDADRILSGLSDGWPWKPGGVGSCIWMIDQTGCSIRSCQI